MIFIRRGRVRILIQNKNIDWWELTSVEEKKAIYKSQQQLKNGKGISHEKVRQKADKLLGRKLIMQEYWNVWFSLTLAFMPGIDKILQIGL